MSVEENKALVRRFHESGFQEIMRGNLEVAHQYFADDFHDHTSLHPEHTGVQGAKEAIADTGQAWPDMWFERTLAGDRHARGTAQGGQACP